MGLAHVLNHFVGSKAAKQRQNPVKFNQLRTKNCTKCGPGAGLEPFRSPESSQTGSGFHQKCIQKQPNRVRNWVGPHRLRCRRGSGFGVISFSSCHCAPADVIRAAEGGYDPRASSSGKPVPLASVCSELSLVPLSSGCSPSSSLARSLGCHMLKRALVPRGGGALTSGGHIRRPSLKHPSRTRRAEGVRTHP